MNIDNNEDVIDSRDVIERIAELEGLDTRDETEMDELRSLLALVAEADGLEDWQYGATLIRDSYFIEYAQQLAEELGLIDSEAAWPAGYIDWERAAGALQMDYTSVEFDGVTYWAR